MRVSHVGLSQPQLHLSKGIRAMLSGDTGYRGDEEDDESDSSNSPSSDQTFKPEDLNSTSVARSMETPQNDISCVWLANL